MMISPFDASADLVIRATRAAANTSTGNQTFTFSNFGGNTVKGALVIASRATADNAAVNSAVLSIGATDCSNQWVTQTQHTRLGSNPGNFPAHYSDNASILAIGQPFTSPALDALASFVSCQQGGVTINWSQVSGNAELVTVIGFGGSSISIDAGDSFLLLVFLST